MNVKAIPFEYNFSMVRENTASIGFVISDVDLTGYSVNLAVKEQNAVSNLFEVAGSITDGPNGTGVVNLLKTTTEDKPAGLYKYELTYYNGTSTDIKTICYGDFEILKNLKDL